MRNLIINERDDYRLIKGLSKCIPLSYSVGNDGNYVGGICVKGNQEKIVSFITHPQHGSQKNVQNTTINILKRKLRKAGWIE